MFFFEGVGGLILSLLTKVVFGDDMKKKLSYLTEELLL